MGPSLMPDRSMDISEKRTGTRSSGEAMQHNDCMEAVLPTAIQPSQPAEMKCIADVK